MSKAHPPELKKSVYLYLYNLNNISNYILVRLYEIVR